MQPQISSAKPYCELAVKQPFFETSQSCISTKVPLSHRFKSSPAIPGKPAILGTAGYMMTAGHFHRNLVSSGDLNRGRRTESRVLFGYFLHNAKSNNPFSLQRTSRFCKPRSSTPKQRPRTNKIKTFCRLAALLSPTFCKVQKVGQKNFSACGGVMLLTQHSCRFAAKLKALPCGTARFRQAPMRAYRTHECFCPRRLYNNRCLYRHCSRTNRW